MNPEQYTNAKLEQIRFKQNIQYLLSVLLPLDIICEHVDSRRFYEIFSDNREEAAPRIDAILYNELFNKIHLYAENFKKLFSEELLQIGFVTEAVQRIQTCINLIIDELKIVHLKINEPMSAYQAYTSVLSWIDEINNKTTVLAEKLKQLVTEETEFNHNEQTLHAEQAFSSDDENEQNDFVETAELVSLDDLQPLALDSEQYQVDSDEFILNLAKAKYPNLENDKKCYDYFLSQIQFYSLHDPEDENYTALLKAYFKLIHEVITKTSYWNSAFISLETPTTIQQATHSTRSEVTTNETFSSVSEDLFTEISKHLELKDVGRFVQGFGKKYYFSDNKSRFFTASLSQEKAHLIETLKTLITTNNLKLDQNKVYVIADNFEGFSEIADIEIDVNNPEVALLQLYCLPTEIAQFCFLKFKYLEDTNIKSLKDFYKLYLAENNVRLECLLFNLFSSLMSETPKIFLRILALWTNIQISPGLMKYVMTLALVNSLERREVLSYDELILLKSRLTIGVPEGKKVVVKLTDTQALDWLKKANFEDIPKIFNDDSLRFNKKEVLEEFINHYCLKELRLNILRCYTFVKDCRAVAISKEFFNKLITSTLDEYEQEDLDYLLLEEFLALKSQVQLNDNCEKVILDISEEQLEKICIRKIDSRSTAEYLKEILPILLDDCFQFDKSRVFAELIENNLAYNKFDCAYQMLSILRECRFDLADLLAPIATWLIKNSEKLFDTFESKRNFEMENPSEQQYVQFLDEVIQAFEEYNFKDSPRLRLHQALNDLSEQYQQTFISPPQKRPQ